MRKFQPYHHAWLGAHPERDEAWLRERLKDGFDVHHLDGDHENNDPLNLVLIDGADHLMLHNGSKRLSRVLTVRISPERRAANAAKREAKIKREVYARLSGQIH